MGGAAEACFHAARDYTMQRIQFGAPLARQQLMQYKMGDMLCEIAYGLEACLAVGRRMDQGLASSSEISIIKRKNCQTALDISRVARDMLGGNGVQDEIGKRKSSPNAGNRSTSTTWPPTNSKRRSKSSMPPSRESKAKDANSNNIKKELVISSLSTVRVSIWSCQRCPSARSKPRNLCKIPFKSTVNFAKSFFFSRARFRQNRRFGRFRQICPNF